MGTALQKFQMRFERRELDQAGINMVDLMMWLVIAALLLAAALQGIGFYQRAAWTYQLKNDLSNVRDYIEGYHATNGVYPSWGPKAEEAAGLIPLSGDNYVSGYTLNATTGDWAVRVCSPSITKATSNADGSGMRVNRNDFNVLFPTTCTAY
jgi:Tfp pilus assembly protein PilE